MRKDLKVGSFPSIGPSSKTTMHVDRARTPIDEKKPRLHEHEHEHAAAEAGAGVVNGVTAKWHRLRAVSDRGVTA